MCPRIFQSDSTPSFSHRPHSDEAVRPHHPPDNPDERFAGPMTAHTLTLGRWHYLGECRDACHGARGIHEEIDTVDRGQRKSSVVASTKYCLKSVCRAHKIPVTPATQRTMSPERSQSPRLNRLLSSLLGPKMPQRCPISNAQWLERLLPLLFGVDLSNI